MIVPLFPGLARTVLPLLLLVAPDLLGAQEEATISSGDTVLLLISTALVLLMMPGLAGWRAAVRWIFAGGTVVHVNAGAAALAAALVLGPRSDYGRQAMLPHNVPFVLLGAVDGQTRRSRGRDDHEMTAPAGHVPLRGSRSGPSLLRQLARDSVRAHSAEVGS